MRFFVTDIKDGFELSFKDADGWIRTLCGVSYDCLQRLGPKSTTTLIKMELQEKGLQHLFEYTLKIISDILRSDCPKTVVRNIELGTISVNTV